MSPKAQLSPRPRLSPRTSCVVCLHTLPQTPMFVEQHMPICFTPATHSSNEDIFCDFKWSACEQCGCIQLSELMDLNVLYAQAHNQTYLTETWNSHHSSFAAFMQGEDGQNLVGRTVVEVVGADG